MELATAIIVCPQEGNGASPMLEHLLFSPAALWVAESWKAVGVQKFFVVCQGDEQAHLVACFPEGTELVTAGTEKATERLLSFLKTCAPEVTVVTRPVLGTKEAKRDNSSGACQIATAALVTALENGTELESALSALGVFTPERVALSQGEARMQAEQAARRYSVRRLLDGGVRILDPESVYVDPCVTVGAGTLLLPGTILRGQTTVGKNCEIGPNTMIRDCTVGDHVTVNASQLNESTVEDGAKIGPFAYVRPNCHVGRDVKVGDFVELKNSVVGDGTKISHLTYVGDSDVGSGVNFGCGTVTVNYDGATKFRTTIGDNAFIGCNTNLVAPVEVGKGAYTAAGSTITENVPPDSLAIARTQQVVKKQWAAKRRNSK